MTTTKQQPVKCPYKVGDNYEGDWVVSRVHEHDKHGDLELVNENRTDEGSMRIMKPKPSVKERGYKYCIDDEVKVIETGVVGKIVRIGDDLHSKGKNVYKLDWNKDIWFREDELMTKPTSKTIVEEKDWADIAIINDVVVPDWKFNKRNPSLSLNKMADKFGIPVKEYITKVLKDQEERMIEKIEKWMNYYVNQIGGDAWNKLLKIIKHLKG